MKLGGIDFGNVFGASGVQGFFGEGYWFHRIPFRRPDFDGVTFVAKTATLLPRKGNMSLTQKYTPRNPFPRCIRVKLSKEAMLNAVGLSNPGIAALLGTGKWQKIRNPFWISIMSLAETSERRLEELRIMVDILGFCKNDFSAPFGLQINLSCPNTAHDPRELIGESAKVLEIASALGVPLMPKYSIASAPIKTIAELSNHPACDAICVSNTLPFGWKEVDWKTAWGSNESPMKKYGGGGGLSGKTLRPLVCEWIARLRDTGFTKPINGGGGILCPMDVVDYHHAGASSIFLGSVAVLHPRRMTAIINWANNLDWR